MTFIPTVNELHAQAMELADFGFLARRDGDVEKASTYFRQAFEYEQAAANLVAYTAIEPTRSVLHRSAATLAMDCGEFRAAERLIATALTGDPPEEIAHELRELLFRVIQHLSEEPMLKNES